MRTLSCLVVLFALALLLQPSARADNLVINGSFETGNFNGWSVDSTSPWMSVYPWYAVSGSYSAALTNDWYFGSITQTLTTVPGQTYDLSFWLLHYWQIGGLNEWLAYWGGTELMHLSSFRSFPYKEYTFEVVAPGVATDLTFAFLNRNGYFYLDDVSVTAAPIPEPSTMLLLGGALLAVAALRRR